MMPINPMFQILNIARNGGNPMALMQQIAGQNPMAAQAMRMINGKNQQQLRQIASNMAKERGMSLEQVAQSLGLNLPQ